MSSSTETALTSIPEPHGLERNPLHLIAGIVATAVIFFILSPVIPAMVISFLFYIALEPLAARLCLYGFSRMQAALSVILLIIVSIGLFSFMGFDSMTRQFQSVYVQLNSIKQQLGEQIINMNNKLIEQGFNVDLSALHAATAESTISMDMELLEFGSAIILSIASYFLLVPLILFFLLKDYRSIRNMALGLLPNRYFELGWLVYYRVTTQLYRYFRGVILQVAILTLVASIGLYFIGVESFFIFGICAGFLVVVPYLGLFLAMLIPVIVTWSTSPGDYVMISKIIVVISFAYIHDQVIVVPTVIANAVNMHPLIIILGIVLFGYYLGILGMVIAVPLLATIKIILESMINGLQNKVEDPI